MIARRRRLPLLVLTIVASLLTPLTRAAAASPFATWTPLSGLQGTFVKQYVQDTTSLTVYAATYGNGVYKSTDDSVTWSPLSAGLPEGANSFVYTIYLTGGKVYAGTDNGIYSSDGSGAFAPVGTGDNPDPAHPTKLNDSVQAVFAPKAGSMLAGTVSGGVWRSSDAGQTWAPPAPGNGMPDATTIWSFASFTNIGGVVFAATSNGIFRSTDAGATWTPSNNGISGTTLRVFADTTYPNVYYATGVGGIFRSTDAAVTWANIDGTDANHEITGDVTIRDLVTTKGTNYQELFAATSEGIWAGSVPLNANGKGPVTWRHLDETGLTGSDGSHNTILWALFDDLKQPTFITAGTQSNGGYRIMIQPPANDGSTANLPKVLGTAKEAATLSATTGTWTGTPLIEYAYQWQLCTSTSTGTCSDIDKATEATYVIPATDGTTAGDANDYLRVKVTGTNDTPGTKLNSASAYSALTAKIGAKAGTEPGANQHEAGQVDPSGTPAIAGQISAGDVVQEDKYLFNPAATSYGYQWMRCDTNGDLSSCVDLPGQTRQTYTVSNDDVTDTLCASVTGTATTGSGANAVAQSTTIGCDAASNQVLPAAAAPIVAPSVLGMPYVGSSVIGNVGNWGSYKQNFTDDWEVCSSPTDPTSCETHLDDKTNIYTPTSDDLGQYLRFEVYADPNGPNQLPYATDLASAASAAVTSRPPPPVAPVAAPPVAPVPVAPVPVAPVPVAPLPVAPPAPAPPQLHPVVLDRTAPTLSTAKLAAGTVTADTALKLAYKVSEAGTLMLVVTHSVQGHRHGTSCTTSAKVKTGKLCTVTSTVARTGIALASGSHTLTVGPKIGGKLLAPASYALLVTPVDAAGNVGKTVTLKLTIKPKPKPTAHRKVAHRAC